jgi:SNF2 family DNA or RNA helicase
LNENHIKFVEIKGSIKTREKNLELFRTGKTNVIFLNSNYNGAGINLTEATDIILFHEMNSYTENQIVGRANRIGRSHPLSVHHLQIF